MSQIEKLRHLIEAVGEVARATESEPDTNDLHDSLVYLAGLASGWALNL